MSPRSQESSRSAAGRHRHGCAPNTVTIKGAKGTLSLPLADGVTVAEQDKTLQVCLRRATAPACVPARRARTWPTWSRASPRATSASSSWWASAIRAAVQGKTLNLTLGFSHAVNFAIPEGITIEAPTQTEVLIKGIDKQRVGQVAAEIRGIRPPEPYKGKGVKYSGEKITPEGRQEEVVLAGHSHVAHLQRPPPAPRHQDPAAHPRAGRCPAHGASHAAPYLCAGVRPVGRQGPRHGLDRAGGGEPRTSRARAMSRRPRPWAAQIAERAKAAGISKVAFDRSGFRYHGRVKALADAAREAGLEF